MSRRRAFTSFGLAVSLVGITAATASKDPLVKYVPLRAERPGFWKALTVYATLHPDHPIGRVFNREGKRIAATRIQEFKSDVADVGEKPTAPWELQQQPTVGFVRPDFASVLVTDYSYTGGAHPNTNLVTYTIGLKGGKATLLKFQDVHKEEAKRDALAALIVERLRLQKPSTVMESPDYKLNPTQLDRFVVTRAGISWVFPAYDVASYAEGSFTVKLTAKELIPFVDSTGPFAPLFK